MKPGLNVFDAQKCKLGRKLDGFLRQTQSSYKCAQNAAFSLETEQVKYPKTGCINTKLSDKHNMTISSTVWKAKRIRWSCSDLHTGWSVYKSSLLLLLGLLAFWFSVASFVAASLLGSGSAVRVRLRSVGGTGTLLMLSIAAASSPLAAIFSSHDHMTRTSFTWLLVSVFFLM